MKTITKNLKPVITGITLALVLLISFNLSAQSKKLSDKDIAFIKSEFRKGMVDFVEGVKPIYKSGMSYNTFKSDLLGKSVSTITTEGDALLLKAYNYISKSTPSSYILKKESGKELAAALHFVKQYNAEKKSINGDLILFGNTTGDTFPSDGMLSKRRNCRWYQLGCHLSNAWNWLLSDPDGDGENNFTEAMGILLTICEFIGC